MGHKKEREENEVVKAIQTCLKYIGEDPSREGLLKTPSRVIRAWNELFQGYCQDPSDIFTTFDLEHSERYSEIILLKDCEMYSTCEHHLLPFMGKVHVAYIPGKSGRVVGISKLARLVELFSRRLQIQERLSKQITSCLTEFLKPAGAACIVEASHMCMRCRGVQKQNSVMVTSSLTGCFMKKNAEGIAARAELFQLIRG